MTVIRVEPDIAITVRTSDFPGGLIWAVRQSDTEAGAVTGPVVAGFVSPSSGSAYVRIPIAPHLAGSSRIFIRAVSNRLFSYNYVENQAYDDGSLATATADGAAVIDGGGFYIDSGHTESGGFYIGASQIEGGGFYIDASPSGTEANGAVDPTVSAISVIQGVSATILVEGFPPDRIFTVRMNDPDREWNESAFIVGSVFSGPGGSLVATLPIPAELAHLPVVRVHLRSADGFYAFNNFYNAVSR